MINLKLIRDLPRWRVGVVHVVARLMGVLIHVEGFPFGSSRLKEARGCDVGEASGKVAAIGRIA